LMQAEIFHSRTRNGGESRILSETSLSAASDVVGRPEFVP
jgi:hypothetical protein